MSDDLDQAAFAEAIRAHQKKALDIKEAIKAYLVASRNSATFHMERDQLGPLFEKFRLYGPWSKHFHININHFTDADPDGLFHDHPFAFRSLVLKGGYQEEVLDFASGRTFTLNRFEGQTFSNLAHHTHRIVRLFHEDCWTLFIPGIQEKNVQFYRIEGGVIKEVPAP